MQSPLHLQLLLQPELVFLVGDVITHDETSDTDSECNQGSATGMGRSSSLSAATLRAVAAERNHIRIMAAVRFGAEPHWGTAARSIRGSCRLTIQWVQPIQVGALHCFVDR